jgi:WD40 repeat protein
VTDCPELGALETSPLPPELRDHVSTCTSCKLVVEVFDAAAGRLDVDDCMRFDALLAARADGTLGRAGKNLLERHLASCETCREVAETLSPTQDADGDQATLPEVDPGSYELGLEVARGGMGRVIAARDLRIGRPIAIKELLGRSPQLAARFEREARVTARLQHPGIVPIYEIGKWPDGTPFYSMRMVDGRMLVEAIDSAKSLTARLSLLPAVIAATEAVAFAHSRRVIHRDLTPSNILVGAYGETVVIDWGLAKDLADTTDEDHEALPENSSERLTGAGAVIGTATYMPPEQAHAVPVDERADVYALGAILYHLCAGGPPYRAKTARELLRAVKTAPPPPIDEVQPGTPRDLVSIITKAMARDPDARYPSARELAEELKRFQTGRLVEAHVYSRYELFKRFLRRNRAVVTATALAVLIGVVFGTLAVKSIIERGETARNTVRDLIQEKGRIELLGGNPQRALAYLNEAQKRGAKSADLSFLIGSALHGLATPLRTLDCGGSNVRGIAFDRTGTYVAAACHEVAKVWRVTGKDEVELAKFEGDETGFDGVKFSADGKLVATWGESGVARVWNLADGKLVATLDHAKQQGVPTEINRLTFTPDALRIATTASDGSAIVWDVASQKPLRTLSPGKALVRSLASLYGYLSSDGKRLYAMTPDGNGYGWDVETGASLGERQHGSVAIGGDISPDDAYGASCGTDGRIRIWDLEHGVLAHQFAAHSETVWKCIFSADSQLVLSGGEDGRANVYDVESGVVIQSVEPGDIVIDADISKDGRRFSTTGMNGRVKVWDTRSGALVANLDSMRGRLARFAPDGEHFVVSRGDGRLQIWRLDLPAELRTPTAVEIGNGGAHAAFAATGFQARLEVRDLATQRAVSTVTDLAAPFAIAESAPFVAGSRAGAIRVVDLTGATQPRTIAIDRSPSKLQLSADGRRLALEFAGAAPQVWDVGSAQQVAVLKGAVSARLSQRGNRAIAWTPGQRPVIWDVDAKTAGATLATGDNYEVIGLAHVGKRAVTREDAETAKKVRLWDAETGALIAERLDNSSVVTFDPKHELITTIDVSHVVTVWSTVDGSVKYSFLGEQPLLQASVQPNGTFVAAIAEHGKVALLMSATDGRILARWPLDHPKSEISEVDGYKAPAGTVTWSADGGTVISRSGAVGTWRVANKYTLKEQQELVRHNVPWRIDEEGKLEWISVTLNGTVVREEEPQPGVRVQVVFRAPPDLGVADVNWSSSKNRMQVKDAITNDRGEFTIKNLRPGEYTFTVGETKVTRYVGPEDEPITIELP